MLDCVTEELIKFYSFMMFSRCLVNCQSTAVLEPRHVTASLVPKVHFDVMYVVRIFVPHFKPAITDLCGHMGAAETNYEDSVEISSLFNLTW